MNQARKRPMHQKVLSMILVLVMLLGLLSVSAFTMADRQSSADTANTSYKYNIMFLDCGRKYYSVDSIKKIIDNASAAGFNYIQLAVGNDGLRFLLDDMSLTVNGTTYGSDDVKSAIQTGNKTYNATFSLEKNAAENDKTVHPYDPEKNELTQSEMDTIIAYASSKGMGVIPCVNTPGHMDAILSAATSLTGATCAYNGSARTIDVTNTTAVAFTKAVLQKYINYFAGKGCQLFNIGADEYANDIYTGGSMGFGNLQLTGKYSSYVEYVNELAAMIKTVGMKPMAFNDGIYFANNTSSGTFDTDIIICYWSSGWTSYEPMSASDLSSKGFKLINTNGEYYWVLGKNAKCSSTKASSFDKTVFPGSEINNPVGSMFCIWADYPGTMTEDEVISGTAATISCFGATVKDSVDSGEPKSETITVAVSGKNDVTVDGDCSGTYTTADPNVATVTAESTTTEKELKAVSAIESGKQYLLVNTRAGKALTDNVSDSYLKLNGDSAVTNTANLWTLKSVGDGLYTVMSVNGKYLSVGNTTASASANSVNCMLAYTADTSDTNGGYWDVADSSGTYHLNHFGGGTSTNAGGWTDGVNDKGSRWYIYEIVGGTKTTITFSGVSKGTTTVTIGNVKYTIKVVDQALADAEPLTIEYWITNRLVTANGATSMKIDAADSSVYSASGAKFTDLVPAAGTQDGKDAVFWKGTRLTSGNKQTATDGVDQTMAGNDFTYIRYWDQKWSFSADGTSWADFNDDDQVVAYYLQKTDVTSEITTNVVDWGQPYSEWKAGGGNNGWFWDGYVENGSKYVFLDFAVVYEDNTQNPSSFPTDNTLFYHFDGCSESKPRVLGAITFTENENYEIWKVTVTDGTSDGYSSYKTFAPTYYNTTETTVWDESMGGIPHIDQLQYTANRSGKLIRVYVKAKVTEDSLTVNYYDESNKTLPFYSYNIAVASGTIFSDDFAYVSGSPNGSLINNTVENIKGVTQTVNWQLENMSEIGAQYRFGNYTFTNATMETGNKVVNLYYRFKPEKTFVVDFGLPLHIEKTDINQLLATANITSMTVGNSLYATVKANSDYSIDYVLNKTIDGSDRVTVSYTGTKVNGESDSATYNLNIIPATTVYYEDSFATFNDGTGAAVKAQWSIVDNDGNVTADKSAEVNQALSALGAKDIYGYDDAYKDSTKLSMGSAHKVTVSSDMADSKAWEAQTDSAWPSATFTFKGTGFDVISLTNSTSGAIFVDVYAGKEATGSPVKRLTVNNYYGYKQDENGKWVVDASSNRTLYQIPVMKVSGLDYGEYTAVIRVAYSQFFDTAKKDQYSFWLDAIRVYDPMDKDNATYVQDNEGYPQYIKLRDALADGSATAAGETKMVFIDGGNTADIKKTYANYGPNNEVYLAKGQAIAFNVSVPNGVNVASIQIGAKAPEGNAAEMSVNVKETPISSATEMYYTITSADGRFTITNTGTGALSLTNLKITFSTEPSTAVELAALTTADQESAVAQVRALFAAPAEPFQPDRFEASWGHSVRKGDTATLTVKTSEDVEAITVDGQTITTYDTKTERTGWGWWAKTVTYREFTYQVPAAETTDYTICAVNSAGVSSDPITATLTVRPSVRDWWHGIFDKWF